MADLKPEIVRKNENEKQSQTSAANFYVLRWLHLPDGNDF